MTFFTSAVGHESIIFIQAIFVLPFLSYSTSMCACLFLRTQESRDGFC
jgi:hypothetical protein